MTVSEQLDAIGLLAIAKTDDVGTVSQKLEPFRSEAFPTRRPTYRYRSMIKFDSQHQKLKNKQELPFQAKNTNFTIKPLEINHAQLFLETFQDKFHSFCEF